MPLTRMPPLKTALSALAALLAAPVAVPQPSAAADLEGDMAVLQWLDKVTARVSTIEAPVGETVRIGTLEILVRACRYRPPEETPEEAAFLDITESKPGAPSQEVFRGWMFASSPALSAMEHPIYDVWVLDCFSRETTRADG
ncbi:DUF2155 domain-containing protein [Caenispirillum salinarum]|uniref:DUF2155 domain-containing protein n=1 Tax=Caenispirillum salinarum TaxID=859058 RepID=UPI001F25F20C|nr:DUF2155 domain-containing protein [Caenispirillum salinarum]